MRTVRHGRPPDLDELVRLGEEVLANALGFGPFAHKLVAGESR